MKTVAKCLKLGWVRRYVVQGREVVHDAVHLQLRTQRELHQGFHVQTRYTMQFFCVFCVFFFQKNEKKYGFLKKCSNQNHNLKNSILQKFAIKVQDQFLPVCLSEIWLGKPQIKKNPS